MKNGTGHVSKGAGISGRPSGQKAFKDSYMGLFREKQILGWAMYDWANSAFSTIVVSAFLGPYLSACARKTGGLSLPHLEIRPDSIFPFLVSISVLLQLFILPVVGAIGDMSGKKKGLFVLFAAAGSLFTMLLWGLDFIAPAISQGQRIFLLGLAFVFANLFFGASVTLYNSFLIDICPPESRDRVSSFGWALGYLGGGLALALCMGPFLFIRDKDLAVRFTFLIAGLWWLVFTVLFPAKLLKPGQREKEALSPGKILLKGFKEPFQTLFSMYKKSPKAWRFLLAFFFYNDGVQTVIAVASIFAVSQLGLDSMTLLLLLLFIQFVAIFGTGAFGILGEKIGTRRAILFSLLVWTAIIFAAAFFLTSIEGLFILAFFAALVLGGTQALSRSLFSLLIPASREAEFFGFYEISEKGSSWLGPLVFGLAVQLTGNTRLAMLSISFFFVAGFFLLVRKH